MRIGYRFNSLCPAPLNTPLLQDWLGDDKEKRQRREIHFPTGRFGEAIEQAQMVVFLASDDASFVNAQEMIVDGGMTKVSSPGMMGGFSDGFRHMLRQRVRRLRRRRTRPGFRNPMGRRRGFMIPYMGYSRVGVDCLATLLIGCIALKHYRACFGLDTL